jgi:hydroxymethylpyrimidine pyrophosphatase-like HAD family hydrolase
MMVATRKISLVLADVDGSLVNEEKVLTKRAQSAVSKLRRAGIRFAITSGRPPVCTENLNPDVVAMKFAKDRI